MGRGACVVVGEVRVVLFFGVGGYGRKWGNHSETWVGWGCKRGNHNSQGVPLRLRQ